ncbi:serine hydrolase [Tautonia plasticadhaerens]|uniref:Penicillin-binding protein 4 n=1 Tax=Tautonia plasticadhaerens TaxID=2527974 RepID=A0A518H5J7_9BACT|nr:serine hydrolase [Tautonia plasticadhaerens]QDV36102.1 Penicillin-binding protein 4* [Tautonia plasticadhaerens]
MLVLPTALAVLIAPPMVVPDADPDDGGAGLVSRLEEYMEAADAVQKFNGSVIVTKDGEPLLARGYGLANFEHEVPNTPGTKFRLASVTKQFTAMAALILAERGKLGLDDPISEHLPETPESWGGVTIRHLLTHTSGIPSYTGLSGFFEEKSILPLSQEELIGLVRDLPLEFEPGSEYRYNNSGYFLLGMIIERASGSTYESFLREEIFEPLGMEDSGYDRAGPILKGRASGYERVGELVRNSRYLDMGLPFSAGALYSTVEDLARWDRALAEGKLISGESYEAMWTPVKDDYAFGWLVRERDGHPEQEHAGGINGFTTQVIRYPDDGVFVAVLGNVVPEPVGEIARDLAAVVLGLPYEVPRPRAIVEVDPAIFDDYVGRYRISPEMVLEIVREGDRLLGAPSGQDRAELSPTSETEFLVEAVRAEVEFLRDDEGNVTGLVLIQGGRTMQADRLDDTKEEEATPAGDHDREAGDGDEEPDQAG